MGAFKRPVPVYAPELCPVETLSLAGMFAQCAVDPIFRRNPRRVPKMTQSRGLDWVPFLCQLKDEKAGKL